MKYLNYGNTDRGCSDSNCKYVHPTMCDQSLKTGTCSMFRTRKRCNKGYHRKGTKPSDSEGGSKVHSDRYSGDNSDNGRNQNRDRTRPNQELTKEDIKSFFGELLRGEMVKLEEKIVNLEEKVKESNKPQKENQKEQEA